MKNNRAQEAERLVYQVDRCRRASEATQAVLHNRHRRMQYRAGVERGFRVPYVPGRARSPRIRRLRKPRTRHRPVHNPQRQLNLGLTPTALPHNDNKIIDNICYVKLRMKELVDR